MNIEKLRAKERLEFQDGQHEEIGQRLRRILALLGR